MTKGRYVFKDGKFQPTNETSKPRVKPLLGDEIVSGIEHPANGEVCYSRSRYKAITKEYGLEEAYGEPDKYFKKKDNSEQESIDLENDVEEALALLNYGEGISEEELELCRQKNQQIQWQSEQEE